MKRVPISAYPKKSHDDYKGEIFVYFGIDVDAPGSWPQLAKLECDAMRARDGKVNLAAREAAQINGGRRLPNREDRRAAILAALPGTKDTIAATVGVGKSWVSEMLYELRREGRVDFRKVGSRSTVWEINLEAAQ